MLQPDAVFAPDLAGFQFAVGNHLPHLIAADFQIFRDFCDRVNVMQVHASTLSQGLLLYRFEKSFRCAL